MPYPAELFYPGQRSCHIPLLWHHLWRARSFVGIMPPSTNLDSCRKGRHVQGTIGARVHMEKSPGHSSGQGQDDAKATPGCFDVPRTRAKEPGWHQNVYKVLVLCIYLAMCICILDIHVCAWGAGPPQRSQHGSGWANIHKISYVCTTIIRIYVFTY